MRRKWNWKCLLNWLFDEFVLRFMVVFIEGLVQNEDNGWGFGFISCMSNYWLSWLGSSVCCCVVARFKSCDEYCGAEMVSGAAWIEGEIEVVVGLWHVTRSGSCMWERNKHLVRFVCCLLAWEGEEWGWKPSDFSEVSKKWITHGLACITNGWISDSFPIHEVLV
jgi:hypothetical protein